MQNHITNGSVSATLARELGAIAKVSPSIATACADLIAEGTVRGGHLVDEPDYVIDAAIEQKSILAIRANRWESHRLEDMNIPVELVDEELLTRAKTCARPFWFQPREADTDAARSFGCLLEVDCGTHQAAYICDPAFILDRVRVQFDRHEKQVRKQAKSHLATDGSRSSAVGSGTIDGAEADRPRPMSSEDRAKVRHANLELGRNLMKAFAAPSLTRDIARLLASIILAREPEMPGRGMRYTFEDWQQTESRTLKNGATKTKVIYPAKDEARSKTIEWVLRPRKADEIIGRLLQVICSAQHSDQMALPKSDRSHWILPSTLAHESAGEIPAIIAKLAAKHLPEHMRSDETEGAPE